jgi:hypothetical protein
VAAVGDAFDSALAVVAVRVGLTAGREQVRVARALRSLPLPAAEFAAGRLSYSKIRAVPRVATTETEATLVEWALHATAAQLDRLVAAQRRVKRAAEVRTRHEARFLSWVCPINGVTGHSVSWCCSGTVCLRR